MRPLGNIGGMLCGLFLAFPAKLRAPVGDRFSSNNVFRMQAYWYKQRRKGQLSAGAKMGVLVLRNSTAQWNPAALRRSIFPKKITSF